MDTCEKTPSEFWIADQMTRIRLWMRDHKDHESETYWWFGQLKCNKCDENEGEE